ELAPVATGPWYQPRRTGVAASQRPDPKHARPRSRHLKVEGALRRFVGGPHDDDDGYGGPGGWWIFGEVDVRFDRHETTSTRGGALLSARSPIFRVRSRFLSVARRARRLTRRGARWESK